MTILPAPRASSIAYWRSWSRLMGTPYAMEAQSKDGNAKRCAEAHPMGGVHLQRGVLKHTLREGGVEPLWAEAIAAAEQDHGQGDGGVELGAGEFSFQNFFVCVDRDHCFVL